MRNHNSRMEFYLQLFEELYHDVVDASYPQNSLKRDLDTIRSRSTNEGIALFTTVLPRLGKAVMRSLGTGTRLQFSNFQKKKGTELPAFCWEFMSRVFRSDGFPLQWEAEPPGLREIGGPDRPGTREGPCYSRETTAVALRGLLQLTMSFYKLNVPYTNEQEAKVVSDFVATEDDVPEKFETPYQRQILESARRLCSRVLNSCDPLSGSARHGPGAVATGEKIHQKHHFSRYYRSLDRVFPYDQWMFYNSSHLCDSLQELQAMEELEAGTAKVVLVPKDSRGPRLISCEPLEFQWIQQSLLQVLVPAIESHPLTKGFVNFTDQEVNRRLALESSISNDLVTLDMKEASDRVGLALVRELVPAHWFEALDACRSKSTRLPCGKILPLKKFAPMGSAVCFPIEALIFWALSVAALDTHGLIPEGGQANVYVYGDDIICESVHHALISSTLEAFGLKLNADKCCTASFFRESCGMEAFYGLPVTPTKFRCVWSRTRKPGALLSYVAQSNELYSKGYHGAADYLERRIREIWGDIVPTLPSSKVGIVCFVRDGVALRDSVPRRRLRFNRNLHRREILGLAACPTPITAMGGGWSLMLRENSRHGSTIVDNQFDYHRDIPCKAVSGQYAMVNRDKLKKTWTPLTL